MDSNQESRSSGSTPSTSTLLSRLRAGSLPYGVQYVGSSSPFGSTGWTPTRDRSATLANIRSSHSPNFSSNSGFSRDGLSDSDVKTLDYLGLAETPQNQGTLGLSGLVGTIPPGLQPLYAGLETLNPSLNRYRSYSVNATEKYAGEEDDYSMSSPYSGLQSGAMTPSAASAAAALAATQAKIHQHNLAVQAFANQASASRPRAKTAGMLDSPMRLGGKTYLATPSRLDASISAADLVSYNDNVYAGLPESVRALQLNGLSIGTGLETEENGLEGPTRALWLGSIPTSTTVSSLEAIFGIYGKVESARVLVHKNCGFVNFEDLESAIHAKAAINGKEIFPGAGPIRIGYAKVPSSSTGTPGKNGMFPSPSPDPFAKDTDRRTSTAPTDNTNEQLSPGGVHAQSVAAALHVPDLQDLKPDMLKIVREFGASEHDVPTIGASIDTAIEFNNFEDEIPAVAEPSHARVHDAPKLREIRKRIDNGAISQAEIEEIALGMLPEIAELASDYLGNTVVQKLFEFCSESVKESMLNEIAPHLAEIGIHKNGTWAAQKIIEVAKTPTQIQTIVDALRPYTVGLFLDQYGNYVLQCCLRFGYPWNNFIFETMLSRLWEVAQGRFGARAMRACLESHHSTKDQQRMLASAIALHSVQLATNANGALLLTWFLDTCMFPQRRTVLAPRLVPHLVHLCTHKVAYLTVLKVINQKTEFSARETILQALFFTPEDKILEDILSDQACGATFIFKVLTTPFFNDEMRSTVVQKIRNILSCLKSPLGQGYKRLMDEVGLSSRAGSKTERDYSGSNGNSPYQDRSRSVSQQGSQNRAMHSLERRSSSQYPQGMQGQSFGQPSLSLDTQSISSFDQFNVNSPVFTPSALNNPQLQYQQALLNNQARSMSTGGYYPTANGLGGFAGQGTFDGNRFNQQVQNAAMLQSPVMQQQAGFGAAPPPGFGPLVTGNGMMGGYAQAYNMYYPQQMQQQAGGRRGRVSSTPFSHADRSEMLTLTSRDDDHDDHDTLLHHAHSYPSFLL